jgi:hypothetical protein
MKPLTHRSNHHVVSANGEDMGGYQSIWLETYRGERTGRKRPIGGAYRGASDHRKDGADPALVASRGFFGNLISAQVTGD